MIMRTTKLLLVAVLSAAILATAVYAGKSSANISQDLGLTVKEAIYDKLTLTNDMNATEADIVVKVDNSGNINAVAVFYPEKEVVNTIKRALKSEKLSNTNVQPGLYFMTIKFQVK